MVEAFQTGDRNAFDELVRRHRDRIFNLCVWFLTDYQEADDMAQEVFIKAFRGLSSFRGRSGFYTWLYRIAVNTCKNRLGSLEYRFKKRTQRLAPYDDVEGWARTPQIADPAHNAEQALQAKERTALIRQAIHRLPKDKKTVIILRDIEGLAYDEIVNLTGFKIGTVKSRLARARGDLKQMLGDMLP